MLYYTWPLTPRYTTCVAVSFREAVRELADIIADIRFDAEDEERLRSFTRIAAATGLLPPLLIYIYIYIHIHICSYIPMYIYIYICNVYVFMYRYRYTLPVEVAVRVIAPIIIASCYFLPLLLLLLLLQSYYCSYPLYNNSIIL